MFLAGLFLFITLVHAEKISKPTTTQTAESFPLVIKPMASPVLDGRVDLGEWASAAVIERFVANTDKVVKASTRMYAGYDSKNLYLAYVCDEPMMSKTGRVKIPGHDREIYNSNETVYIFLNPQADRASYMQFIVDILNQRYEALGLDPVGFNPPWQSAVQEESSLWSVEIAIPFQSLGCSTPQSGQAWYGNFFRLRRTGFETSAWRPTGGGFESPGFFGLLIFESIKKYLEKSVAGLEADKATFSGDLAGEGERWKTAVKTLAGHIGSIDEKESMADYASLAGKIDTLRKERTILKRKSFRVPGQTVVVSEARPYELFSGEPLDSDRAGGPVQVTMLRDEWVDLAWNLNNMTDQAITVRCSTLSGKDKLPSYDFLQMELPGLETFWQQAMAVATADGRVTYDAIVPVSSGVVQIPAGQTVQVWLTVHVPRNSESGIRQGRAVIQASDGSKMGVVSIPLTIQVLPFQITAKRYMNTFTWNVLPNIVTDNPDWHRAHLDDLVSHGVNIFMLHSASTLPRPKAKADGTLIGAMDFSRLDKILDATRDRFDLYYLTIDIWEVEETAYVRKDLFGLDFNDPNYAKAFKTWYGAILDHLKSRGVSHDKLLVNPYDESTNENCQKISRWIKEVDPKSRIVIDCSTANMTEARTMDALTDVWVPHYKHFFMEELNPFHQMVRDSKKPYWVYYYSEGGNEKAQDPTRHYLAKFWWAYEKGLTGIGYWANQYYGDPWYRKAYTNTYDTSFVYPVANGVVPSRRWQAWRRGWQDYTLLSMLRSHLEKTHNQVDMKKLNEYVHAVVSSPGDQVKRDHVRQWVKARL